jgi:2-amino-4-hydroxy-6-hydroxymethyldihydropteridine diphosphokinase
LRRAVGVLGALPRTRLVAVSGFYRNPPIGGIVQPDFVNAVAGLLTQLPAPELLACLKQAEADLGRVRGPGSRWGPRCIDLDLLVYGAQRISAQALTVPHPGIEQRNFVLFPLLEIAPGLTIPGLGPVAALAARLDRAGLEKVG